MRRRRGPGPPRKRRLAPEPAPSDLEPLLALLNTAERRHFFYRKQRQVQKDLLDRREDLERWLAAREIVPEGIDLGKEEHRRTLALRDALRDLVESEDPDDPETLRRLRELGDSVRLRVSFGDLARPDLAPVEDGLEGAFATWLWLFVSARREGRWDRVKECEGCSKIFYDPSPNNRTKYCTTRCGDRVRSRRRKTPRKRKGRE